MSRYTPRLWAMATLMCFTSALAREISPEVVGAYHRSEESKAFVIVKTKHGNICVQKTEVPQWLYRIISINDNKQRLPLEPDRYLRQMREQNVKRGSFEDQLTDEQLVAPFLPMTYINPPLAITFANVASEYFGLSLAYEISAIWESNKASNFKFRRTGKNGFRLPTIDEWKDIAPKHWNKQSDKFRCLHGNLGGDLLSMYQWLDAPFKVDDELWEKKTSCADGYTWLAPVASYLPTWQGLYDVWGNVAEFAESLPKEADAEGWHGLNAYTCGGSYYEPSDFDPSNCSISDDSNTFYGDGIRLVIEPESGKCPKIEPRW